MNSERWHRLQLLFEEALAQPEDTRNTFVQSACGDDTELSDEVISLLEACEGSPEIHSPPTAWFGLLAGREPPRFVSGDHVANRYRVERLLGRGGAGEVYEAWDDELSIPVALKTLHLEGHTEEAHKRLKLEGMLARSVWHPHVCRLYDLGRHVEGDRSTWFLTMELLRGKTLAEVLQEERQLPLERAQRLAEHMAAGLGAAHQAGIVHRDLKPGNVMLVTRDSGEQAVVMDFGIARAVSQRPSEDPPTRQSGPIVGTPAYMAPEQLRGEEVSPAADIYALGIVLYEMVTGTLPFPDDSGVDRARRRLTEDPPSPRSFAPDLDDRWEAVILRCLAREPRRRFGHAEDVAQAFKGRMSSEQEWTQALTAETRHTLPAERDAFLGREIESAELARCLAGSSRLVTLVGAGGMGKTRLAVHHGWRSLGEFPGGVWFCDLTEARNADGIASAVASSLGVPIGRGDSVKQLGHAIAGRGRCLMILDNFEQAVDHAAATVGKWMARAEEARFLVTSREKLNLGAPERVLTVEPLSIEAGVELFADRARRLRPGLELIGSEAESAREIVRLVDGMPLAIELAGARMRIMTAAQILAQMRKRFSLLTGGAQARHETLATAIDGSWELLKPWEQSAWAQCSVFEGGFTMQAAEEVVDLSEWPEAPWVVDVVQSLVDKSLLRTWVPAPGIGEVIPDARIGMFMSLQEYARMRLHNEDTDAVAGGAARAVETRHGQWYARLHVEVTEAADRREVVRQRRRVERELDNLMVACRHALARGDGAIAATTYRGSWEVLRLRGPFGAAVELGRGALRDSRLERADETNIMMTLGSAEWFAGMMDDAVAHTEAAISLARELGDRRLESFLLCNLGGIRFDQGRVEEANTCAEMSLAAARELGDRRLESNLLGNLSGIRHSEGRMEEAITLAEMALVASRLAGEWRGEGVILGNLGAIHNGLGRTEQARTYHEAALAIHREMGNRRSEGIARGNLGGLHFDQGEMAQARAHFEAALDIHRELGQRLSEGIVLRDLGSLHAAEKRFSEALSHYDAALAIHRELGNRPLEGSVIVALGRLHQDRGEMEAARAHYNTALDIHREVSDRRSEGSTLAYMASLLHSQGSIDAAWEALTTGEQLLREVDASLELGELLCVQADLEHASGRAAAAATTLREAETLAMQFGSGPESELGRMIANLRRTFAQE